MDDITIETKNLYYYEGGGWMDPRREYFLDKKLKQVYKEHLNLDLNEDLISTMEDILQKIYRPSILPLKLFYVKSVFRMCYQGRNFKDYTGGDIHEHIVKTNESIFNDLKKYLPELVIGEKTKAAK